MVWCLAIFLVPLLLGIGGLEQRLVARRMQVPGHVWPLVPFESSVPFRSQVFIRAIVVVSASLPVVPFAVMPRGVEHRSPSRRRGSFEARVPFAVMATWEG